MGEAAGRGVRPGALGRRARRRVTSCRTTSCRRSTAIGANEYIVDVTHEVPGPDGKPVPAVDFISTVDTPYVWELNIWYHTLNVGLPHAHQSLAMETLFSTLIAIGAIGIVFLVAGSWLLASGITRPLSTLSAAARQLQQGVYEPVTIRTQDELSELAESFNAMTGALRDRERKIMHLAFHDAETRLPNRLALERRLAAAPPAGLYLAVFGVDRFAQIRAAIGYAHAETLIKRLGARLRAIDPKQADGAPLQRHAGDCYLAKSDASPQRAAALAAA